jgi:hypothetical protein
VSSVVVAWQPSTGATFYDVYRDGVRITPAGGVTATSYTDSGVPPGTHSYDVDAGNGAGTSAASPPVSVWLPPATRSALLVPFTGWPVAPVRSGAHYTPARFPTRTGSAMTAETTILSLDKNQPVVPVLQSAGQHNRLCTGNPPYSPAIALPFDQRIIVPGSSRNDPWCFIASDGVHRWEGGYCVHCTVGGELAVGHPGLRGTITDDATGGGGSGGSAISTLAGTIRVGEFTNGTYGDGMIRHCLRWDLCGFTDLSHLGGDTPGSGFHAPALHPDGGYSDPTSNNYYGGPVSASVMGSLAAIPQSVDLSTLGLLSEPGRKLAWTAKYFGGRCCNNTVSSTWAICVEQNGTDSVEAEFRRLYGFSFGGRLGDNAWTHDADIILRTLQIIDNDGPAQWGGPGTPLQPLAPAFG